MGAMTYAMLFSKHEIEELMSSILSQLIILKSKCLSSDLSNSLYIGTKVNVENSPNISKPTNIEMISL